MQNIYIIRNSKQELVTLYYGKERSIYIETLREKVKLVSNVSQYFSVAIDNQNYINITYQDLTGNIYLAKEAENFKSTLMFESLEKKEKPIILKPLFWKNNLSLLFNSQLDSNQATYISVKTLKEDKSWTQDENIDTFIPSRNEFFNMKKLNEENFILIYQKMEKDLSLGYKEIINGKISDFIPIHKTTYQIVDYSFLTIENTIHFIYIVKNLFSSQLIYRKKEGNFLSSPIVLHEGQKIKNCSISFVENKLYCNFIVNSNIYYSISEDLGINFSNIFKTKISSAQNLIKAKFIDSIHNKNYSLNEIYTFSNEPASIQFIPEAYPEFLIGTIQNNTSQAFSGYVVPNNFTPLKENFVSDLYTSPKFKEPEKETISLKAEEIEINKTPTSKTFKSTPEEYDFMSQFNMQEFEKIVKNTKKTDSPKAVIEKDLNTKNNNTEEILLENKLKEKNKKLQELDSLIELKTKEKLNIENQLKEKIKKLEEQNKQLKEAKDLGKDSNIEKSEMEKTESESNPKIEETNQNS